MISRNIRKRVVGGLLLSGAPLLLLAQAPAPASTQSEPPAAIDPAPAIAAPDQAAAPDSARPHSEPAPYTREVWSYPLGGRPDPTHPPSSLRDGSNLPDLRLSGILLNADDPSLSRVAFRLANGERRIVGVGDTIPPYIITTIEPNRVEVKYPQLGGVRTRWIERPTSPAPR